MLVCLFHRFSVMNIMWALLTAVWNSWVNSVLIVRETIHHPGSFFHQLLLVVDTILVQRLVSTFLTLFVLVSLNKVKADSNCSHCFILRNLQFAAIALQVTMRVSLSLPQSDVSM